jgi:hypothetical protein
MALMRARVRAWDADRWGAQILEDTADLCSPRVLHALA